MGIVELTLFGIPLILISAIFLGFFSAYGVGANDVEYKIFNSENFELVEYYREPLRLGRDVFSKNKLSESTINKLIAVSYTHLTLPTTPYV